MADDEVAWLTVDGGDVLVRIHVVPNASRTAIVGPLGDRLKLRVAAAPDRGKANEAVCRALVDSTGASRAEIVVGHGHKHKTVRLIDVDEATVRALGRGGG